MFGHLRTVRRLCLEKILLQWILQARALSGADAINALRPFYFAVHPDFFGQHPREREINENSLKRLNGYLENIQKPGYKPFTPTRLTFYVREREHNSSSVQESLSPSGFRAVSFTLHTRDLLSTVLDILNSCSLSTEHVQSLNASVDSQPHKEAKGTFYRPIKWDKTYYSFTGFKDPEEELEQAQKMETTLISWLENNEESAIKKLKNSLPRRKELERLKSELCHQLQLSDIRWQRSWDIAHRCSQLHSLSRLAHQRPEVLMNVKGYTVIFTDCSGLSATGHIMLGTMDVHHHWTKIFEILPNYKKLQKKLLLLEDQISHLLGGIQITYIEELQPLLTLEEYYTTLDAFYTRLLNSRLLFHPRSLRGLKMILESDRYAPSLHELGHFSIPAVCDPATLQWFIITKAQQARENLKKKEDLFSIMHHHQKMCIGSILVGDRLMAMEKELISTSTEKFSLKQLYKEPSVSSAQMINCCKRLLEESLPYLQGMHLCVSHFYSVLQDGDLCIPWNWKS
ncbi:T-cell activation inhibitor, mitochondrial isoform X3 [Alligator mississippiensis]|uniref:T-cell activation inhibitor, mitochondrial isoform X3 n=1 Tax=Alligator mississippiensis TaxID=8496 RepID=UPI002878115B|nr:T-cell activation inhibitor, mitochondrial isoform X3 [Alligator mississippiensis]XP_059584793.1 T-cell activation inhibitor, mitochondrial isoform X3 [Alligator mississippiensis]XP_059584794.1 T-cell activation inhibitor, mitochondrial isoform X3 [Alligator mississippiensis]XP_059584795.1 T-cell activation inhibitor, mitochondrial isoform X3 [Alligator mississippiensis]